MKSLIKMPALLATILCTSFSASCSSVPGAMASDSPTPGMTQVAYE